MVNDQYYQRRLLMILFVAFIAVTFIARLFYLQVLSPNYQERAKRNAYYNKAIYPARGIIFDRNGNLLVANKPAYDLMVTMSEVPKDLDTLSLARVLSVSLDELRLSLQKVKDRKLNRGYSPYTPQILMSHLEPREVARLQEQLYKYTGFNVQSRTIRHYEYHHAAHILGYLAEASSLDLERDSLLAAGDYVGKSGVERRYDSLLRGVKGQEILLRDSRGRIKGKYNNGLDDVPTVNGRDLTLSIDSGLQAIGERMMHGKRGAIVAIEPETGEVLALVTSPTFDPAILASKDKGEQYKLLEQGEGKPLLNRA
ncbi:MAG: penicillin-binding protein 2, partial [Porphyromonas sp.]|nr:penicillin-binding protein 2 [Porphyromonas sp.]